MPATLRVESKSSGTKSKVQRRCSRPVHTAFDYEKTKLRLVDEIGDDRTAYTEGKVDMVASLLEDA